MKGHVRMSQQKYIPDDFLFYKVFININTDDQLFCTFNTS